MHVERQESLETSSETYLFCTSHSYHVSQRQNSLQYVFITVTAFLHVVTVHGDDNSIVFSIVAKFSGFFGFSVNTITHKPLH